MNIQTHQKTIQQIFQLLFDIAAENYKYSIPEDQIDGQISALTSALTVIAEKMLQLSPPSGSLIPLYTFQSLIQNSFILSKEFRIESYSNTILEILDNRPNTLYRNPFNHISLLNLKKITPHQYSFAYPVTDYFNTHYVSFKVANNTAVAKLLKDADVIQQLHHYILAHLDAPLPTIKELAKLFGTNTFTLKSGFRNYFNTSIYHFYNEQRLKKAHDLLQQTSYSVKEIGYMTGFNDYSTFYKAFKKQYGCAPSDLFR